MIFAEQAGVSVKGGPGAECVNAGTNWLCHDGIHYCQDWLATHQDHDRRVTRLKGQYFTEFEVDPMAGELLLAIVTGPLDGDLPEITLDEDAATGERILTVPRIARVHLPKSSDSRQPWTEADA